MDVILYYDVFIKYLDSKKDIWNRKTESEILRDLLIEDKFNRLILSSKYLDFLYDFIINYNADYEPQMDRFVEKIDNEEWIKTASSGESKIIHEEFIYLVNNNPSNVYLAFSHHFHKELNGIKDKVNIISNYNKPNKHWANLRLGANNVVTVRNNDFNDDLEIEKFFQEFYNIPRKISIVYIFDSFCKVDKHSYFDYFSSLTIPIEYYSSTHDQGNALTKSEINERKCKILTKLGNTCKFFIATPLHTHPRVIIFENIVIDLNHDFAKIKTKRTWKVDVCYGKKIANKLLLNCKNYEEQ